MRQLEIELINRGVIKERVVLPDNSKHTVMDKVLEQAMYSDVSSPRYVNRARVGTTENIDRLKAAATQDLTQNQLKGLGAAGARGTGSASAGIVPPRGGAAAGRPSTYEPKVGAYKPDAPSYGGLLPPAAGAAAAMRGFQNEREVARITGGRLARDPSRPNVDAVVRFTRENGQGGAARIDVVGPKGELIVAGGPAKAADMGALSARLNDLRLAAESRGVTPIAYFTNDSGAKIVAKASEILGKENVRTFDRPTYKYP